MNNIFCRKCGKKIDADSKFCVNCGEKTILIEGESSPKASPKVVGESNKEKKSGWLVFIEIVVWVTIVMVLFNFIYPPFDWLGIIINLVALLLCLGYLKEWHSNFEIPLALMSLMVIINIFAVFSIFDILLFSVGVAGLIFKKKALGDYY